MKKRTKISLVAMSLCLVIALGVFGIFAVKTLNMSVCGNITFTADGILASISKGTMAGGSFVTPADADTKMKAVEVTTNKTETELNAELASWQGLNLAFAQSGADVTITFTIKNNSTQANSYIDVKTTINNGTAVNAFADVSPSWVVIDPGATQTFVITLSVITTEINASLTDFVVGFALSQTNTKTQTTNLSFDVGTAGNAANFPTTSYEVGTVIEQLDAPNVTNKAFDGWYKDAALTQKVEFPFTITADTKLYAKYIEGTLPSHCYQYDSASDSYHVVRSRPDGFVFPEVVIVPDMLSGPNGKKPVTKIVDATSGSTTVFGSNSQIKQLYIGNNVTHLGSAVAANATALEKVVIPDSVVSTGDYGYLFYGCAKLKDVTYSKNLKVVPVASFMYTAIENVDFIVGEQTKVLQQAFAICNSMTDITIPQTIVSIGAFAFAKSEKLTNVNLYSKLAFTSNAPFWDTPYEAATKNKIVSYYDIPNSKVLVIADGETTDTTQIPGYETITHVSGSAFMLVSSQGAPVNNTAITNVDFPNAIHVGTAAFYNCASITSVSLPNVKEVGDQAFYKCTNLKTLNIENIEIIGRSTFSECSNITSVSFNNVKQIGAGAFNSCSKIPSINLPEGLLFIGDYAFNHCSGLNQSTITIPSTVVQIGGEKYIGDNNTNGIVGSLVFYNAATSKLTSYVVAEGNSHFTTHQGVLYTKDYKYMVAYPSASTMTSYEIPEGCQELFELGFSRPHYLKSLTLPNSLNVRRVCTDAVARNHPDMNNINNSLYIFNSVDNLIIKENNQNYKSIDGIVYTKDGKEVIAIPPAKARDGVLTLADSCEKIIAKPIMYSNSSSDTLNGIKVGGRPAEIVIGANIKEISAESLTEINSYTWTITSNSPYYTVNSEGKLVKA